MGGRDWRMVVQVQPGQKKLARPYYHKTYWIWWYTSIISPSYVVDESKRVEIYGGP
jgi:hypothetical protein